MTEMGSGANDSAEMHDWVPRSKPNLVSRRGRFVEVARFDADRDAEPLFAAINEDDHPELWTFIPMQRFESAGALSDAIVQLAESVGWLTYVFRFAHDGAVGGMASLMNVNPGHGVLEVGFVVYSPGFKRTSAATEAMALLAGHAFDDLGYRRYEWKCDSRNDASRAAALRYGFRFEGIFRQHMVARGRNRDTAWFSITDVEWPTVRGGFYGWLDPVNFDDAGRPIQKLSEMRAGSGSVPTSGAA